MAGGLARRFGWAGAVIVAAVAVAGLVATRPGTVAGDWSLPGDARAGELVFHAGGCASCHAAPGAEGDAMRLLSGGLGFTSAFGTFYAPNISPHPDAGIGDWTVAQFARAVMAGVSPEGQHYYPVFPYAAYRHMTKADLRDLFAFMRGLPASDAPSRAHDVSFPFSIRRGIGIWKRLYVRDDFVVSGDLTEAAARGRYLVEALAHCGECHTPRNVLGGLRRDAWLGGGPNPAGKGKIPDITPAALEWSQDDLVAYFTTGLTPDYDSVGGEMADVVDNLSRLPKDDLEAIAAYLKIVPPVH